MPPTNRRPRAIDASRHFCPYINCDYRGWLGRGNLRANSHPSGGPWRQFQCTACTGYFLETHGTLLHGKRVAVELIVRVLACLAEGLGIRATARVFEVDPNTVLQWLVEAADQLEVFSRYFLCDVHVHQVQLDELYAVLRAVQDSELSENEAIKRLERSPCWVWTALDPESKLLVVIDLGPRTLAMAQCIVHQVAKMLAPGCVPLCLTCVAQALARAQNQQAKSFELRTATSLARLYQRQGKRAEAHELLAPVYGRFTEGFETADLQDAKALLEELAGETAVHTMSQ